MDEESPSLEFATIDQITDEIDRRTKAFVLVLSDDSKDGVRTSHSLSFGGGLFTARGLSEYASAAFTLATQAHAERYVENYLEDNDT